jgi:peptidoglycan/LPS O-acetylase OafA/YrhL
VLSLVASAPFFFFAVRNLDLPFFAWSKQHLVAACLLTASLLQSWVPNAALTWNSVCWSLSVEAFFYAIFPLALLWTAGIKERSMFFGAASWCLVSLFFSLLYFLLHPDGISKINSAETTLLWKNVLSFNPLARLPEFMAGVYTGRLFLARRNNPRSDNPRSNDRRINDRRVATPLILGGVAVVVTIAALVGRIPSPLISAGFLSPAFAAIIYGLALQPKWASFLEVRWLVLLGDASYSLYLLHSIVITKVFDALAYFPWWCRVCGAILAAVGASILSYRLIEEPGRRILRPRHRVPQAGAEHSLQNPVTDGT